MDRTSETLCKVLSERNTDTKEDKCMILDTGNVQRRQLFRDRKKWLPMVESGKRFRVMYMGREVILWR